MKTVIFDFDGTLADNKERWSRYDKGLITKDQFHSKEEVSKDKLIQNMFQLYLDLSAWNDVIILTARHESDREVTESWLKTYFISYKELIMDKNNDTSASEFKRKAVEELREKGVDVWLVIDDNDEVISALKSIDGVLPLKC